MLGRPYLSIGDVLTLLKEEFPDVTISKIRFLESQGLVEPERTPSGYRKFYDSDVDRLRWILRQQREHFLPLKVIKGKLAVVQELSTKASGQQREASTFEESSQKGHAIASGVGATDEITPDASSRIETGSYDDSGEEVLAVSDEVARESFRREHVSGASFTITELAASTGLSESYLMELESYGLLEGRQTMGAVYYDEDAFLTAKLAAAFSKYGVGPRHLRLFKYAAEREASLYTQIVLPLFRQRNPEARQKANDALADLSDLGRSLKDILLRKVMREQVGG